MESSKFGRKMFLDYASSRPQTTIERMYFPLDEPVEWKFGLDDFYSEWAGGQIAKEKIEEFFNKLYEAVDNFSEIKKYEGAWAKLRVITQLWYVLLILLVAFTILDAAWSGFRVYGVIGVVIILLCYLWIFWANLMKKKILGTQREKLQAAIDSNSKYFEELGYIWVLAANHIVWLNLELKQQPTYNPPQDGQIEVKNETENQQPQSDNQAQEP